MITVLLKTADNLQEYVRVPQLSPTIQRMCTRILRLNGESRFDEAPRMLKRTYVLWTRGEDGIYVYREDL